MKENPKTTICTKLETPIGYFTVSLNGQTIPFKAIEDGYDIPWEIYFNEDVYDDPNNIKDTISPDGEYYIELDASQVIKGEEYVVLFDNTVQTKKM